VEGSNLRQSVLDFINLSRTSPQYATDPAMLQKLEDAAAHDVGTFFGATSAPIADDTWEARTIFAGANPISERVQVTVAWPCVIVGMFASLSILTTGGTTTPTLNDLDAIIDLNTEVYKTSVNGTTTPTSALGGGTPQRDGNFVTLAALSTPNTQGGRLMAWRIGDREARLGVTFRWKQGGATTAIPAGIYKDSIVSLAFFVQRIREDRRGA
jgi:hypothetical protein